MTTPPESNPSRPRDPPGAGRRRFPRVAHPFLVRYPDRRKHPASWRTAPLRDLSVGGARFLCECRFYAGERITLALVLPAVDKPVPVQARIVWAKPSVA